jgi:Tfp pilus assembly protein PilV
MLLEVTLAAALLAIGLFVMLESLSRCVAAAGAVQNQAIASNLLANKSYEFRVERPRDFAEASGTFDDYPTFTWARTLDVTETEGLYRQTIAVYWMERGRMTYDALVEYRYLPDKEQR